MQSIGSRLKEEREAAGLSQQKACDIAGVVRKTLFNYESGERAPDAAFLAALATAGVDVQYVITGERKRVTDIETEELKRAAETAYQMVTAGGINVTPQQFSQMFVTLLNAPQMQASFPQQLQNATAIHSKVSRGAQIATGSGIVQVRGKAKGGVSKKTQ